MFGDRLKVMNQVMVITGGSRGIGPATASLAARRGYTVCVNYLHNREAAVRVVKTIQQDGGDAISIAADISSEADVVDLFGTVRRKLGKVTALVNNAGILERQMRLENMDGDRLISRRSTINTRVTLYERRSLALNDNPVFLSQSELCFGDYVLFQEPSQSFSLLV